MDRNFPRLLDTLAVLQRTGRLTTTQIKERLKARGHEVHVRTVQRDLEQLATVYPIECDDSSKPFSWSWRADARRLSVPGMDWPEAISFDLLDKYLDGVLPPSVKDGIKPYVTEARAKLAQHFDLPLRRWPDRIRVVPAGPPLTAPRISRAAHEALIESVLLGRQAKIQYRREQGGKSYVISPLGLVQYGAVFYLPVRFDGHDDVRTIALHRVQRAELLESDSNIESFDLEAWLAKGALGFGGTDMIQLVIHCRNHAGDKLLETQLAEDQIVQIPALGEQRIQAKVRDTQQLRRWLLCQGRDIEVIEPKTLRQWLADEHSAVAKAHRA